MDIFIHTKLPHFGRDKTSQADHQSGSLFVAAHFSDPCV